MPLLDPESLKQFKVLGRLSTVGIELALSIALGFFGGRWLDGKFGTEPWIQWIGFGFGLAAGFKSLIQATRRLNSENNKTDNAPTSTNDKKEP